MTGAMSAWVATFFIALGIVLLLAIAAAWLARTGRTATMSFYCPWARRSVTAQFLTCEEGQRIAVLSCTALADPRVVSCGRLCVGGERQVGLGAGEGRIRDVLSD